MALAVMTLAISSPAFAPGGPIPPEYTADGPDVSPPLEWTGVPAGAKSVVLIVDDPDAPDPKAPRMTWVHWVLYDIPASAKGLGRGVAAKDLPPGAKPGLNDWKESHWRGPSPPVGRHRYFFKLYALDTALPGLGTPTKAQLEAAMKGHVLAHAELMGTYQRSR